LENNILSIFCTGKVGETCFHRFYRPIYRVYGRVLGGAWERGPWMWDS